MALFMNMELFGLLNNYRFFFMTTGAETNVQASSLKFFNTSLYVNRELSWIDFNQRVLEEALNPEAHPLLERVKFISIFSSNLDEYFMIRVAGIEDQYEAGIQDRTIDGLTPAEQLEKIRTMVLQQLS